MLFPLFNIKNSFLLILQISPICLWRLPWSLTAQLTTSSLNHIFYSVYYVQWNFFYLFIRQFLSVRDFLIFSPSRAVPCTRRNSLHPTYTKHYLSCKVGQNTTSTKLSLIFQLEKISSSSDLSQHSISVLLKL